jgi:uncharacterized protein (TIGR00369 family)
MRRMADRPPLPDLATLNELLRAAPFHQLLDVHLVEADRGRIVVRVDGRPELVGNPLNQALHGGAIAGLIDLAGSIAAMTEVGYPCPTVDLRVDFLRPAIAGKPIFAEGRLLKAGQSVSFSEVDVRDEGGRHVARGSVVCSTLAFKG